MRRRRHRAAVVVPFTSAECAALRRLPAATLAAFRALIREITRATRRRRLPLVRR